MRKFNILLVGDASRDIYHYGFCNRISPEAPVPILDFTHTIETFGMAFNVNRNLRVFGNNVDFSHGEPAIKQRYVDLKSGQQIMRLDKDFEQTKVASDYINFHREYDAVVISDYNKGFLTRDCVEKIRSTYSTVPIFVDTKKKDLQIYEGCIVKINEFEYQNSINDQYVKELIVTLGASGAMRGEKKYLAQKVQVHDVTGAGDVFLASLASIYLTNNDLDYAIEKSIALATESVKHPGSYTLTQEDLNEHLNNGS